MAVTRGNHHAGQNKTLLRRDDVFDPLAFIQNIEQLNAKLCAVFGQIGNLTTQVQSLQAALDKALHMQKTLGIGSGGMVPPADDKTTPTDPELISVKSLFQTN